MQSLMHDFESGNGIFTYEPRENSDEHLGHYSNDYTADAWIFKVNERHPKVKYYAADVVVEQYTLMATKHDFFGRLPKEITRQGIINQGALATIEKFRASGANAEEFFKDFIANTDNGRSSQRILNVFGMEAYAVKEFPPGKDVTLLVRKQQ